MLKLSAQIFAVCAIVTLFAGLTLANESTEQMPPPPPPVQVDALGETPVVAVPVAEPAPVAVPAPAPTPAPANAPTNALGDLVPPQDATPAELAGQLPATEYPLVRLTPDKIEVVRLDKDAVNVIVGNSTHLLSVLETPRQILLIPRQPGATHFQVLDAKGNTIMERSVIIAAPKQDYVRVRRTCATVDGGKDCAEYSVYYCPDMCHAVAVTQKSQNNGGAVTVPTETASAPSGETINDGEAVVNDTAAGAGNTANTAGAITGVQ